MIRVFLIDGALQALLQTDFGQDSCSRQDYLIDVTDIPVYFEVTAGKNAYTIESWLRDNSAAKMLTFGQKTEIQYGQTIDSSEEGPAGTQKVFAGVARQLDRYFSKTGFLKNNNVPSPEDGGILLSYDGQETNAKVVTGDNRPSMKCYMAAALVQGKTQIEMARPYKDEIMKNIRVKWDERNEYSDDEDEAEGAPVEKSEFQIENGVLVRYDGHATDVIIPTGVTAIGNGTSMPFFQSEVENVTVPDGVKTISGFAFYNCETMKSINLPASIETIEHHAFRQCSSLTTITIPDTVETIGRECFWGCLGLVEIILPKNLKVIEEKAFSGCVSVPEIEIPDGTELIEDGAFWGDGCLKKVTIPASVTSIGYMAFCDCDNLTIYGSKGSYAEEYANENDICFRAV